MFDSNVFIPRQANQVISSSGSCGSVDGVETTCLGSVEGNCCSYLGFCGSNSSYCGAGCQSTYGDCGNSKISTDGSCGAGPGWTCLGASMGNCCSSKGYCGDTSAHCSTGCQPEFGDCYSSSGNTTTAASTPSGAPSTSMESAPAAAATSSIITPSAAPKEDSVTSSAGFKAGISVAVIAIAGGILGIGLWLWRRRRQQNGMDRGGEASFNMFDHKEMPTSITPQPQMYHELHDEQRTELDGSQQRMTEAYGHGVKPGKTSVTAYELPVDGCRHKPL